MLQANGFSACRWEIPIISPLLRIDSGFSAPFQASDGCSASMEPVSFDAQWQCALKPVPITMLVIVFAWMFFSTWLLWPFIQPTARRP